MSTKPEAGQWLFCRKKPGATAKKYGVYIHKCLPNGMFFVEVNPREYELVSEKTLEGYDHEPRCTGWDWVVPEPQPAEDPQQVVHYDPIADRLVLKPHTKQIRQKTPVPDECDTAVSVTRDFSPEIGIAARKEDPDEWVEITDKNHVIRKCDQLSDYGTQWYPPSDFTRAVGKTLAKCGFAKVRCRRRDLPKVEQVEQCISHDEHRGEWRCPNPALPGKDHCSECETTSDGGINWPYHEKQKKQPKKTMLRLWIDSDCNIHAGLKNDRDLELHYDHETRQFYTEEPS